jgi:hypothetical protein
MARKPRSEWSPAYRRRIERGEAQGKTRQQARGKPPSEHIQRASREARKYQGVGPSETARVNKFAREQAKRGGGDPDASAATLRKWTREKGFARFLQLKETRDRRAGEHRTRAYRNVEMVGGGRAVLHISVGTHDLAADFEDFDLPDMPEGDDWGWLFYH